MPEIRFDNSIDTGIQLGLRVFALAHTGLGLCVPFLASGSSRGAPFQVTFVIVLNLSWTSTKVDGTKGLLDQLAASFRIVLRNGAVLSGLGAQGRNVQGITFPKDRTERAKETENQ